MMARQTDYFLQIFKTIGVPLVGAALSRVPDGSSLDPKAIAQPVAELLTKSVQMGIDLGALVELEKQGEKAESARIAMTALAGDMLGGWFALQGKMPEMSDMQRITEGLRTVKEFSATFEASPEATLRLETLKPKGQAVDALQSQMQLFVAFVPVIEALTSFPIGEDLKATVQMIVPCLNEKAAALAVEVTPHDLDKIAHRTLLSCMAALYAQCHEAEGQAMQLQGRPIELDNVWKRFNVQFDILEALTHSIVPSVSAEGGSAPAPLVEPPLVAPPVESAPPSPPPVAAPLPAEPTPPSAVEAAPPPPVTPAPPAATPSAEPPPVAAPIVPPPEAEVKKPQIFSAPIQEPAPQEPPPPAEPVVTPPVFTQPPPENPAPPVDVAAPPVPPSVVPAEGNPMSFFSKKPVAQAPPATPPSVAPAAEPAAPPPLVEQSSPPAVAPPSDVSSQTQANPMSFFSKKNTEEGEAE